MVFFSTCFREDYPIMYKEASLSTVHFLSWECINKLVVVFFALVGPKLLKKSVLWTSLQCSLILNFIHDLQRAIHLSQSPEFAPCPWPVWWRSPPCQLTQNRILVELLRLLGHQKVPSTLWSQRHEMLTWLDHCPTWQSTLGTQVCSTNSTVVALIAVWSSTSFALNKHAPDHHTRLDFHHQKRGGCPWCAHRRFRQWRTRNPCVQQANCSAFHAAVCERPTAQCHQHKCAPPIAIRIMTTCFVGNNLLIRWLQLLDFWFGGARLSYVTITKKCPSWSRLHMSQWMVPTLVHVVPPICALPHNWMRFLWSNQHLFDWMKNAETLKHLAQWKMLRILLCLWNCPSGTQLAPCVFVCVCKLGFLQMTQLHQIREVNCVSILLSLDGRLLTFISLSSHTTLVYSLLYPIIFPQRSLRLIFLFASWMVLSKIQDMYCVVGLFSGVSKVFNWTHLFPSRNLARKIWNLVVTKNTPQKDWHPLLQPIRHWE